MTEYTDSTEHHEPVLRLVAPIEDHTPEAPEVVEDMEPATEASPGEPDQAVVQAPRACEDGCVIEGEHDECVSLNQDFFAAPTAVTDGEADVEVEEVVEPAPRRRPRVKTEYVTRDMDIDATPTFARLADEFNLLILQR